MSFVEHALSAAATLLGAGHTAEAKAICIDICAIDVDNFEALLLLGTVERREGNIFACLTALDRAAGLRPDDPGLGINLYNALMDAFNRAANLEERGCHDEAAALFRAVLRLQPGHAVARDRLDRLVCQRLTEAHAALQTGRGAEAAAICRNLLAATPDHPRGLHMLGVAEWELGHRAEALVLVGRSLAFEPGITEARRHLDLMASYARTAVAEAVLAGRWAEALSLYGVLRRVRPAVAAALDGTDAPLRKEAEAAERAWREGLLSEAEQSYRRWLRATPDDAYARRMLTKLEADISVLERSFLTDDGGQAAPSPLLERIRALYARDRGEPFLRRIRDADAPPVELTYRDMVRSACWFAEGYARQGVAAGDTVVLILEDPLQVFLAMAGAMLLGAVPSVFAHPSPKVPLGDYVRTLMKLLDSLNPGFVLCDEKYAPQLSIGSGRRIGSVSDLVGEPGGVRPFAGTRAPAFLQFTSGTTGLKKGVAVTEAALLWQVDTYASALRLGGRDHIVSWLPFYHDMGLVTALLTPLLTGTPVTLIPPFVWVAKPSLLLRAVSEHAGTLCWLPNFAYAFLARSVPEAELDGISLTSLRGVINCSEPIRQDSQDVFLERFRNRGLRAEALAVSYAMAENTFAITSGGFADGLAYDRVAPAQTLPGQRVADGDRALVSSGRALPGVELRILDGRGESLPDRWVGEIAVRSPSLFSGYFRQDDATREAFRDGFFLTGDIGYLAEGELYVTGRRKDLIIASGRNLYPQDIEAAVSDVPGVVPGRCVAVGIDDEALGTQRLVVIAETRAAGREAREALAREIGRAVTAQFDAAPQDVLVVDHMWLLKSSSGKIARDRNRIRYLEHRATADTATAAFADTDRETALVVQALAGVNGGRLPDRADTPLLSAGFVDSLGLIALIVALEAALGRRLPSPAAVGFDAYNSIAAIAALIRSGQAYQAPARQEIGDRQIKVNHYTLSDRRFDTLVLGSSRTFVLSCQAMEHFGRRAFHFGANAMMAEELYAILRLVAERTKEPIRSVIVGIDPELFNPYGTIDARMLNCRDLMLHLDEEDRNGTGSLPHVPSDQQLSSSAQQAYWQELQHRDWGQKGAVFDSAHGDYVTFDWPEAQSRTPRSIEDRKIIDAYSLYLARQLTSLHPKRLDYFARFLALTAEIGAEVRAFVNPMHPKMRLAFQQHTPYVARQEELLAWLRARPEPGLRLFDVSVPARFGGDDGDFTTDGRHLGFHNADRLLTALLEE